MKRITFWLMSTVTILVLLFSYRTSTMGAEAVSPQTSVTQAAAPTTQSASSGASTPSSSGSASSSASSSGSGSSSGSTASSSGTYTGDVVQTRWGPVEVAITVVDVVQYPNGNGRDAEINAQALPILKQETISAQSAQIDTVSGATVTSDGYLSSLQSAIDKAGLG